MGRVSLISNEIFKKIVYFVALIILFPILLVVVLFIKLKSKGPVFFLRKRFCKNGKSLNNEGKMFADNSISRFGREVEENNKNSKSKTNLSIVILTWNSSSYFKRCLDSIYENITQDSFEVVVVDNGSKDKTVDILNRYEKEKSNFKCILLNKNYGTTKTRNIAIRETKGDFVLFLDSDTEIMHDTVELLLNTLKEFKDAALVAPRLVYPDLSVQFSCKKFPTIMIKVMKFLGRPFERLVEKLELYDPKRYSLDFKEIVEVDYCISACWLVRRGIFDSIGLFDENIFYTPEDVDFCLRVWLNGMKVIYNPNAVVIHRAQRVSKRNFKMALFHAVGLLYYFAKHRYFFTRCRIYKIINKLQIT
jgi:GT2 family glycosyltransferase